MFSNYVIHEGLKKEKTLAEPKTPDEFKKMRTSPGSRNNRFHNEGMSNCVYRMTRVDDIILGLK